MCSDGKQCYRDIIEQKSDENLLNNLLGSKGAGIAYTSMYLARMTEIQIEKRKNHNITSDGSLLGDYVR